MHPFVNVPRAFAVQLGIPNMHPARDLVFKNMHRAFVLSYGLAAVRLTSCAFMAPAT